MYMAIKKITCFNFKTYITQKNIKQSKSKHSMTISKSKYYHLHTLDKQQDIMHIFFRARDTTSSLCTYTHIRTAYLYYIIGKYLNMEKNESIYITRGLVC